MDPGPCYGTHSAGSVTCIGWSMATPRAGWLSFAISAGPGCATSAGTTGPGACRRLLLRGENMDGEDIIIAAALVVGGWYLYGKMQQQQPTTLAVSIPSGGTPGAPDTITVKDKTGAAITVQNVYGLSQQDAQLFYGDLSNTFQSGQAEILFEQVMSGDQNALEVAEQGGAANRIAAGQGSAGFTAGVGPFKFGYNKSTG